VSREVATETLGALWPAGLFIKLIEKLFTCEASKDELKLTTRVPDDIVHVPLLANTPDADVTARDELDAVVLPVSPEIVMIG